MEKVTKKELRKTALKLLPAIYDSAMRTGAEDGLFQHEDWRTGLCLDAFLLAEAFEDTASFRDADLEPKLKQLDQSVFDGDPEQIRWAVVTSEGAALKFEREPVVMDGLWVWTHCNSCVQHSLIGTYNTTNWQNSLIERKELTGSDLCRAMLERGDKVVLCAVNDDGDCEEDFEEGAYDAICDVDEDGLFESHCSYWWHVQPVNNQGEPLTQSDVGL